MHEDKRNGTRVWREKLRYFGLAQYRELYEQNTDMVG
jgi:predicted glycosyl hydrolase (DUF1957 family)